MKQIQGQYGGGVITEPQLEAVFHQWLPNQSAGCHTLLDQFFTQWFDTPYPPGGGSNKPQITGPGLDGPGFYNDGGACPRANQAITFGPLPNKFIDDPDFNVSAASDSGLMVSFAASGQCTVSGTTVHITGLGSCTTRRHRMGTRSSSQQCRCPRHSRFASTRRQPLARRLHRIMRGRYTWLQVAPLQVKTPRVP